MTCRHYFLELVNCDGVPCVYAILSGCNSTDKDKRDAVERRVKEIATIDPVDETEGGK
jgi:hypothetical protein